MDRHQSAEDGIVANGREASFSHKFSDALGPRVASDRSRNIAIRIRIAMQNPAKHAANDRQVQEINRTEELM
jgi:hypothetical protein